jgi:polysaccharide biosynthesis/export protein
LKNLFAAVALLLVLTLSSCRVFYPDLMFKTDPDFQYDKPDSVDLGDYRLQKGDEMSMLILSNNGYQLIDILGTTGIVPVDYLVKSTGYATLPLLDSVRVEGLTVIELENYLRQRYSYYFLNPYIRLEVTNKRVMVYTGRSAGRVVTLLNEYTQLIEAITAAGGITGNKAYRIKVIRGDLKKPKVYLFDFSTIEGLKNADFLVTNQDIIYVEPSLTLADVNARILPILTAVTTLVLIYSTISNAK